MCRRILVSEGDPSFIHSGGPWWLRSFGHANTREAKGVNEHSFLAHQEVPRFVQHNDSLLRFIFDRNKPHGGSDRFTDGLGKGILRSLYNPATRRSIGAGWLFSGGSGILQAVFSPLSFLQSCSRNPSSSVFPVICYRESYGSFSDGYPLQTAGMTDWRGGCIFRFEVLELSHGSCLKRRLVRT